MASRELESLVLILAALAVAITTVFTTGGCGPDVRDSSTQPPRCDCIGGEVVVTELMIDPPGVDEGLEYVEIMNVSDRRISLEGLVAVSGSSARPVVSAVTGWTSAGLEPGARAVISEAPPAGKPNGISVSSLVLSNVEGSFSLMCGAVEVDYVAWGESPEAPDEGRSLQAATTASSDSPLEWCPSTVAMPENEGWYGSPGEANHECSNKDTCLDNATGLMRDVRRPVADDLVVTEVFANPDGADTLANEWIEVLALAGFDLGGLTVIHFNGPDDQASSREFKVKDDECHPVQAGAVVVIGGSDLPLNGDSTLYNATAGVATLHIIDSKGNTVATARHPKVPDGASVSLKKSIATGTDAADADDDPASFVTTRCASKPAATPGSLEVSCGRSK